MANPDCKEKILKYIEANDGKKIKQDVVDYMNKEVEEEYTISRVPTLAFIKELETERRIKSSGKRQGQSHFLSINRDNEFDEIDESVTRTRKMIEEFPIIENAPKYYRKPRKDRVWLPHDVDVIMWGLMKLLVRTNNITVQRDAQILYKKITDLMKLVTLKKIKAESDLAHF